VPGKLRGFDWDDANQHHILRYAVIPKEVEEAVSQKNVILTAKTVEREKRWKLFGKTFSGRYLVVIFCRSRKFFRAVTAHDMNANERRTYAPQLD
jgi:uncharacterized DUF497 family protein